MSHYSSHQEIARRLVTELVHRCPDHAVPVVAQVEYRSRVPLTSIKRTWARSGVVAWPVGAFVWTHRIAHGDSGGGPHPTGISEDGQPHKLHDVPNALVWEPRFQRIGPETWFDDTDETWLGIRAHLEEDKRALDAGRPLVPRDVGRRIEAVVVKYTDLQKVARYRDKVGRQYREMDRLKTVWGTGSPKYQAAKAKYDEMIRRLRAMETRL